MKKNCVVLFALLVVSVVAAFVVRNCLFEEDNINNYMTLEVLQSEKMIVNSYSIEDDFSEEALARFIEDECESVTDAEYAFEVSPTGNLYINNSVIMQEVLVDSIIKGQCEYEKIWICSEGSTIQYNDDNTYGYIGLDYSLMQRDSSYLVFCIPSEINEYSDKKVYNTDDSFWFSYYNITGDSEKVMEDVYYDKEMEFYTDSRVVLDGFNELKKEIFEMLGIRKKKQ